MPKKKKIKNKAVEPPTPNVRFLAKRELDSFRAMLEERMMAIGQEEEIFEILTEDEVEQIKAVIFNGLVDSYTLGRKNHFRRIQLKLIQGMCPWGKTKLK